ncbi:uncharacterized protein TNCT_615601 [Trichonephila clavata]|uniref:Uncharacterized protein n=1 Tax=Trichonephila clavata TaxID=2740835 RepID=A0A8X6GNZ3_TRICU|nr:uncharacterized protein TNCT_615601 [Trichonephila clavata]
MASYKKPSLTWALFLVVLLTTQLRESDAGVNLKLKKLLKKVLLLRALAPKKNIAIIPLPIPLEPILKLLKGKMDEKMMMPKLPEMPMGYPMYMMPPADKMMGADMMMMNPPEEMKMPAYMAGH